TVAVRDREIRGPRIPRVAYDARVPCEHRDRALKEGDHRGDARSALVQAAPFASAVFAHRFFRCRSRASSASVVAVSVPSSATFFPWGVLPLVPPLARGTARTTLPTAGAEWTRAKRASARRASAERLLPPARRRSSAFQGEPPRRNSAKARDWP